MTPISNTLPVSALKEALAEVRATLSTLVQHQGEVQHQHTRLLASVESLSQDGATERTQLAGVQQQLEGWSQRLDALASLLQAQARPGGVCRRSPSYSLPGVCCSEVSGLGWGAPGGIYRPSDTPSCSNRSTCCSSCSGEASPQTYATNSMRTIDRATSNPSASATQAGHSPQTPWEVANLAVPWEKGLGRSQERVSL
jgi:hypothetical protein